MFFFQALMFIMYRKFLLSNQIYQVSSNVRIDKTLILLCFK